MTALVRPVQALDHVRGPENAPVTLVEYGDFECPHCGAAHPVVAALERELGDQLRFVFRHFPLSEIHPHARLAAEARFERDLGGHVFEPKVHEDFLAGVRSGVNGTPTFFINGLRYDGTAVFDEMLAAIEEAGAAAR